MIDLPPVNLHFEDSGKWYSLPEWAEYFIAVGKQHSAAPHGQTRICTAIVTPTRAFGAAFVSLGMVVSDAIPRERASETEHFERLFGLPAGTPVVFRQKEGTVLKGLLQEPQEYDGKLWLRVQVNSQAGGGTTHLISETQSLKVQPAGRTWKLPKNQSGASIRTTNKFVDSLMGETDAVQLGTRSRIVCALVGRRNVLEHEIRSTPLSVHVNGAPHAEGKLQDVLRVDRFVGPLQSHRSALVSVGADPPAANLINNVEVGVVFDGAAGFLKWGAMWRAQHQVVVLDRTEPYFDDAISAINSRFSQNSIRDEVDMPDAQAPPGGEILTFREAFP
jgi:hypothetical protein